MAPQSMAPQSMAPQSMAHRRGGAGGREHVAPLYVGSEIYRGSTYGSGHPLAIARVSTCTDLCRALSWLPDAVYRDAPIASMAELARFHHPDYLAALARAEQRQTVSAVDRARFRIGADGNPVYREVFRRPATSAGGVLLAARLTTGGGIVHCPGGGNHHARPARAAGFCYINDAALGLLAWRDAGITPIVYLDIDAHHGDGVEEAFFADDTVFTISLHERGRWPHTGAAEDRAGGAARNLPVPAGFNDSEFRYVFEAAILPLIAEIGPRAIMLQCGADGLEEDPLARLSLSNNAHWWLIEQLRDLAPRLIVLGGGGYNPYSVGRLWAGAWAVLNGFPIPERLPPAAEGVLRGLAYHRSAGRNPPAHWTTTLRDPPREGPIRPEVRVLAALTLEPRAPACYA